MSNVSLHGIAKSIFPHGRLREGQEEALGGICDFLERGTGLLLVGSPPGSGKTDVVLAALKALDCKRIFWIVPTRSLQSQVSNSLQKYLQNDFSFLNFATPKGQEQYGCDCSKRSNCSCKPQRLKRPVSGAIRGRWCWFLPPASGCCPYWKERLHVMTAKVTVMTYHYLLHDAMGSKDLPRPDVFVLDEGHDLEKILAHVGQVSIETPRTGEYSDPYGCLGDILATLVRRIKIQSSRSGTSGQQQLHSLIEDEKTIVRRIKEVLRDRDNFTISVDSERISAIPLNCQSLYWKAFGDKSRVIVLSSTVGPIQSWMQLTGLSKERIANISMSSTIPFRRRFFYALLDGPSLSEHDAKDPDKLKKLSELTSSLLEYPVNTVIHPFTVALGRGVCDRLSRNQSVSDRIITHWPLLRPDRKRSFWKAEEAVEAFKERGGVLLATTVGEGQDFAYDLARLQLILKVPFPDRGDPFVKCMVERSGEEWYNWEVIKAIEQQYGRIVRAEDDFGVTICLDSNFRWFYVKNKDRFHPWFREGVRFKTIAKTHDIMKLLFSGTLANSLRSLRREGPTGLCLMCKAPQAEWRTAELHEPVCQECRQLLLETTTRIETSSCREQEVCTQLTAR